MGELSRLVNIPASKIENDRINFIGKWAKDLQATIVLKGAPTVTGTKRSVVFINSNGNAGMATAGSGDILSGILAGLWSQKMQDELAAYTSVFLHGLAGDLARKKYGEKSMMALDMLEQLPQAFLSVEQQRYRP